jgi:hypothetical protein
MSKQTALQLFVDKITNNHDKHFIDMYRAEIEEAIQMEREQMENAISNAISKADMINNRGYFDFDKWYNETYEDQDEEML